MGAIPRVSLTHILKYLRLNQIIYIQFKRLIILIEFEFCN